MKRLLVVGVLLVSGAMAFAQGTLLFNNRVTASAVDAPVYVGTVGGTLADGALYSGQLYVNGAAAGSAVAFRTGTGVGYITGGTVTMPTIPGGTTVSVELRAWETAKGATYEAALTAGGGIGVGKSSAFNVVLGNAGSPATLPAPLVGLTSFAISVVPEPSTIALGLLGVAGLLIRRRK